MIYLITGVPGSGKSLYAVSTLLKKLMGETIKQEGKPDIKRRLCIDGIPGLLLPHELMAPQVEGSLVSRGKDEKETPAEGHGLWNWFEWCQPGDVIVVDEVQRYWRPRGMGTKVPLDVAKLETHRHYGVDFVLITQNPMLLDQNVRRLVGRHLNVRRVFGGARALIYDWDGCQTDVHRTAGATRTLWSYPKGAYKLYKSSELHTKQHQKIPLFMLFPLAVLALAVFAGPKAWSTLHGSTTGHGIGAGQPKAVAQSAAEPTAAASAPARAALAAPPVQSSAAPSTPQFLGCVASADRCKCFTLSGSAVAVPDSLCRDEAHNVKRLDLGSTLQTSGPTEAPAPAAQAPSLPSSAPAATPAPA